MVGDDDDGYWEPCPWFDFWLVVALVAIFSGLVVAL
jgi:hypothetical protein